MANTAHYPLKQVVEANQRIAPIFYSVVPPQAGTWIRRSVAQFGKTATWLLAELTHLQVHFTEKDTLYRGMFYRTSDQLRQDTGLTNYEQTQSYPMLSSVVFMTIMYHTKTATTKLRYFCVNLQAVLALYRNESEAEVLAVLRQQQPGGKPGAVVGGNNGNGTGWTPDMQAVSDGILALADRSPQAVQEMFVALYGRNLSDVQGRWSLGMMLDSWMPTLNRAAEAIKRRAEMIRDLLARPEFQAAYQQAQAACATTEPIPAATAASEA